jgi:hypothetical protein
LEGKKKVRLKFETLNETRNGKKEITKKICKKVLKDKKGRK